MEIRVKNCCFCINLRTGVLIVSYIGIIAVLLQFFDNLVQPKIPPVVSGKQIGYEDNYVDEDCNYIEKVLIDFFSHFIAYGTDSNQFFGVCSSSSE